MSGSNALLSLLSQDDFQKLKHEIHNHIDKIGGKIEEIAASDEEDEAMGTSSRQAPSGCTEDDDDVILTSYREKRPVMGNSGRNVNP